MNEPPRIAAFEKVSYEEFKRAMSENQVLYDLLLMHPELNDEDELCRLLYSEIRLPERATRGSAGYDFFAPFGFVIKTTMSKFFDLKNTIVVPTGIRCRFPQDYALLLMPKSGLGFKYGTFLANTLGLVDSDYYYSDNEGHIMAKMFCFSEGGITVDKGKAFMQGILVPFGITTDDIADGTRNGGFGSTGR